jgi:Zn-dependent protease with chaperone function
MFSKSFNLILVYILTIFNFTILLLPFLLAAFPFMHIGEDQISITKYIVFNPKIALFSLIFAISFLMICYLFLDFVFGFSLRASLKGCTNYKKLKNYKFLDGIFMQVKEKFDQKSVKLYIKNSNEINAFAIGGMGRKAMVLTAGIINHYHKNTTSNQEFLSSLRSIMGHEMSHLVNKDFLPGLIIITNQKVTNFVSDILNKILRTVLWFFSFVRMRYNFFTFIATTIYNITNSILTSFNQKIIYNIYKFLKNVVSRSNEYRCDRQSAKAFGGKNMAFALSLLGKSGYFTLFSTHPATQRRIKRVEKVKESSALIKPSFMNSISNLLSIIFLPIVCCYFAVLSKVDLLLKSYLYQNYPEIYTFLFKVLFFIKNLLGTVT